MKKIIDSFREIDKKEEEEAVDEKGEDAERKRRGMEEELLTYFRPSSSLLPSLNHLNPLEDFLSHRLLTSVFADLSGTRRVTDGRRDGERGGGTGGD